jgi:hypothetical protein
MNGSLVDYKRGYHKRGDDMQWDDNEAFNSIRASPLSSENNFSKNKLMPYFCHNCSRLWHCQRKEFNMLYRGNMRLGQLRDDINEWLAPRGMHYRFDLETDQWTVYHGKRRIYSFANFYDIFRSAKLLAWEA